MHVRGGAGEGAQSQQHQRLEGLESGLESEELAEGWGPSLNLEN